jgi:hypothetical protein
VTMLLHFINDKGVQMTDEDKGEMDQKSCMQKHKNVMCYKCGKKVPVGTAMTMSRHLDHN